MNRFKTSSTSLIVLLCALLPALPAAGQSPQTHGHSFGNAQKWAQIFDDPARGAWQKPHEVIQALALRPDAVIADIGFRMDSRVGPPKSSRIAPEQVKAELQRAGYVLREEHAFL
ncbi:MAG: hypothetical protein Q8L40_03435, partial [Burkholderiales bacterium]|nr:hypothetical protein [Burkholderiales bacterium]